MCVYEFLQVCRLNTELSQRNHLIQYLARQLRDFCQANDRLFADYESQEENLTSQLRTLRARLADATETLRRSTVKSWRETSESGHLTSSVDVQNAPLAIALLEFAGELQIRLISYNRNLIGDDTRTMANAAANLLTSRTSVCPSEWTELSRHLFQSILGFIESTLKQDSLQRDTEFDELESRANRAEAEVFRLNALVGELRQEIQALNATLSQPSVFRKQHPKESQYHVEELTSSDDTVALCLSSTGSPGPWPRESVSLHASAIPSSPVSELFPGSGQMDHSLQQPQQHEAHVYLHTPTSPDLVPVVLDDQKRQFDLKNLIERLQRILITRKSELNHLETLNCRAEMEKFVWKQTEVDLLSDVCEYLISKQKLELHTHLTQLSTTVQCSTEPTDRYGLYQSHVDSPNKLEVERSRSMPHSIGAEQRGNMPLLTNVQRLDPVQRLQSLLHRVHCMNEGLDRLQTVLDSATLPASGITLDDVISQLELETEKLLGTMGRSVDRSSILDSQTNIEHSVRIRLFEPDQLSPHDVHKLQFSGENLTEDSVSSKNSCYIGMLLLCLLI